MSVLQHFVRPHSTPRPFQYTLHGDTISDPWQWLEDRTDPDVAKWSALQQDSVLSVFHSLLERYPRVSSELDRVERRPRSFTPHFVNKRAYYLKNVDQVPQPVLCTADSETERVLVNPVELCQSDEFSINYYALSPDRTLCAVGIQQRGSETLDIHIIDALSGEQRFPILRSVRDFVWNRDSRSCYFKPINQTDLNDQRPWIIHYHVLGTQRELDTQVHASPAADTYVTAFVSDRSHFDGFFEFRGQAVEIHTRGNQQRDKAQTDTLLYKHDAVMAYPMPHGEYVYWYSAAGGGRGLILRTKLSAPAFDKAAVFIAEHEHTLVGIDFSDRHVIVVRRNGLHWYMHIYDQDGSVLHQVEAPKGASILGIRCDSSDNQWYVTTVSCIQAKTVYRFDPILLSFETAWTDDVQAELDEYETRVEYCRSKDGTSVPLSITCSKNLPLDASHPVLIKGYGGFSCGVELHYDPTSVSFIQRGGILVHAGIRGGDEYGEEWHRAAMLEKKQNCFDDFISAAEYLIEQGYTRAQRIAIQGASNGGLLVGAVSCQRPELYAAVVCDVPLLDMLRYVHFSIARFWIPEYGDPDREEHYKFLRSYSPYHQLNGQLNLPPMLVCVAQNDTRTDPLHGRKFVAAAQNGLGQKNPVMLWVDEFSGHQGGSPTHHRIRESQIRWLFIFEALGISDRPLS